MRCYQLIGLKRHPTGSTFQANQPHHSCGCFTSMASLNQFVAGGGIPPEWPVYVAVVTEASFYALGSSTLSPEKLRQLSHDLGSDGWRQLHVLAGPFEALAIAELACPPGGFVGLMRPQQASELKPQS